MPPAMLMMWKKPAMECGYGINTTFIICENVFSHETNTAVDKQVEKFTSWSFNYFFHIP